MAVSKGFELASLGSALDTSQTDGEVLQINMDTDVVAEGTTNLYFTDERVDDRVSSLLIAGTNVSLTYDDTANTLTIALDVTGGIDLSNNDTDDLPEGSTNLYYTDTRVNTFLGSGSATTIETTGNVTVGGNLTVNGTTTTINSTELAVDDLNITIASGAADATAANGAGITADLGSDGTATILYDSVGDSWVFNKPLYQNTDKVITESVFTGSDNYAFKTITDGTYSAVADSTTDTFTIREGDQIEVTVTSDDPTYGDSVLIGHAISGVTAGSYGGSTDIPVITVDAEGHITTATTTALITEWTITDGTLSQTISGGDTLTVVDGTDINAVVGATDQLTINNTSTLQSVTGRGNTTTNSVGIGTNTVTSGYTLDVGGITLLQDQLVVRDAAFGTAYNNLNGVVVDSSQLAGTAAGYGVGINFTARGASSKKAGIALYQASADPDDSNLRLFVSSSLNATDPVALALELLRGGQVKVSNAYTLPTADGSANQALVTDGSGTVSFGAISSAIDWNVADNYAFKTVSVAGTNLVADSNTDTLTITISQVDSTAGLVVATDANTDSFTIGHADTSTVNDLTSSANTFVNALTFDTYGHVTGRTTGAIDFDVAANYAYKFMTDGTNTTTAASNTDTFRFNAGTDITAVVDGPNDAVAFNNTSTLDSVTGRGNTTSNSITVGDATVNGNLTVNGTTTTLDTQNLVVEDPVIVLNKNQSTPVNDIGFILQRYSSATATNYNVAIVWNEADDRLSIGKTAENGSDNAITASSEWMTVTSTGAVGIGRTNPQTTLDISGNISLHDGGTGDRNIEIGTGRTDSGNSYVDLITDTTYTDYGARFIRNSGENASTELVTRGTGALAIITRDAGPIAFYTNNTLRASISSTGKVGIGTGLSSTMLHLYANNDGGAANNTLRFEDADAGTAVNQQLGLIEFYGNDTSTGGTGQKAYIGAFAESLTPEAYLAFATDGTTGTASERMRITSNGYVGVGTTDPQWHTHVYGSGIATIRSMVENGSTGQASVDLKNSEGHFRLITDDGKYYIYDQVDAITRFNIATDGAITFNDAFTFPTADGSASQTLITDGSGTLTWGSLSASIDWNTNGNYAFTTIATPAGTNPVADSNADTLTLLNGTDISITGDSAADSVTIANTSTLQTVTDRGNITTNNVGIGTNDTNSTLVVDSAVDTNTDWYTNTQATLRLKNTNGNGAPVLKFESNLSRIVYGVDSATDKLIFSSRQSVGTTTEVVTLNNDGEVGIGTVDPLARMHIGPFDGSTTSPHLLLTSSNNAYGWRFDTNDFGSGDVPLRIFGRSASVDTEMLRITSDGSVLAKNVATDASQFIFNDGWSDEARNIRVWAEEEVSGGIGRWFSFLGTNVSKDGDGTYTKPSDNASNNWGNIAGMLFTGANTAGQNAIDFIVDLPSAHGGGLNESMTGSDLYNKSAMSITADNMVGIGTRGPTHKLEVSGTAADGTELLHITSDGDVSDGGYHWMTTEIAGSQSTNANIIHFIGRELAQRNGGYFGFHYAGDNSTNNFITLGGYQADQLLNIKMDGNVGIGTTNPSNLLTIQGPSSDVGTGNSIITVNTPLTTSGATRMLGVREGNTTQVAHIAYSHTNNDFEIISQQSDGGIAFFTGGLNKNVVIKSSGNVGIGTIDPTEKLVVNGSINSYNQSTNFNTGPHRVMMDIINSTKIARIGTVTGTATPTGTEGEVAFYVNGSEKVRLDADGNVGIGTNDPSAKLHVVGGSDANLYLKSDSGRSGVFLMKPGTDTVMGSLLQLADESYRLGTASNYHIQMNQDGETILNANGNNVGIGTDNPETNLDVIGQVAFQHEGNSNRGNLILGPRGSGTSKWSTLAGAHYNDATGSGNGSGNAGVMLIGSYTNSSSNQIYIGHGPYELNPATEIRLGTHTATTHNLGGSTHMLINSTGKVGIGTANPQETLHVNGSVRIDSTYNLDSATATLTTTTQTSILAISATTFGSAKYLIQAYDSVTGERQVSELLVLSDGTTATSTEYAILFTGSAPIATFVTDISGGNIRLLATSASTNSTQYKVKLTAVLA